MSHDTSNFFTSDATGLNRPATADEILDAARIILARRVRKGSARSSPHATRDFLRLQKEALARNAAAVILACNHPSGVAEPAQADELITNRLRAALALIDVGPGRSAVGAFAMINMIILIQ